jgi:glutamate:Na+ symporter, ESS family
LSVGLIGSVALAGLVLFLGYGIRRLIPPLDRLNIPAPVIGGLLVAIALTVARSYQVAVPTLDTTLQTPLMIGFFTTLGFAASYRLLRIGGTQVIVLLVATSLYAIVQNLAGMAVATAFGLHPLFGVLTGSVSLTGGPATSLAFAPLFEQAGIAGAAPVALATAMDGIMLGGLVGAPIATVLVERYRLHARSSATPADLVSAETQFERASDAAAQPEPEEGYVAVKAISLILIAMWAGSEVSRLIQSAGITMPGYIGAMLVAGVLRNLDDASSWLKIPHRTIDTIGNVSLALFLVMAMMNLDLLQLKSLATPLIVNLAVQVGLIALVCFWPIYRLMGRDYDAAVMCGGFAGFMLGTTANAMAVMRSLVERYGIAARAFLVAPLVGAFFLDFTNALIITLFVNLFG